MYLADYLLYRLNRDQMFEYVDVLELPGPTENIRELTAHVSTVLAKRKNRTQVYWADVAAGATFFLDLWRKGQLGKLCLDHIPTKGEVTRLKALRTQTEPPGPWGPPCYPQAQ